MVISTYSSGDCHAREYYVRPATIDRVQQSWIAPAIEQYVEWMAERHYSAHSVLRRVPLLLNFGAFARAHGARELKELPDHAEAFVQNQVGKSARGRRRTLSRERRAKEVRGPVQQMLRLAVPGYLGRRRACKPDNPFELQAPGWLQYLVEEKGLRPNSLKQYRFHLNQFAGYLARADIIDLAELSPTLLSGFIAEYAPPRVSWSTVRNACGTLRVFCATCTGSGSSRVI